MNQQTNKGIFFAVLAAALYALNAPFSKYLLTYLPPTLMAGFLYLGAGLGMGLFGIIRKENSKKREESLTKRELPYVFGMILLDIAAPVFLMVGLLNTSAANASLLNNFEIVATALIAMLCFKEEITHRLKLAILFVTASCILLSYESSGGSVFSSGSIFVLLATACWGFENNCTRMISSKSPLQIVLLKGFFSGIGSLILGWFLKERLFYFRPVVFALLLGFFAYGLSIYFYVYAQRYLGASKTSTYYAVSPFIGALLSLLLFGELPPVRFYIAALLMLIGTWFASSDAPVFSAEQIRVKLKKQKRKALF